MVGEKIWPSSFFKFVQKKSIEGLNVRLLAPYHQYLWERLSRFGAAEGGIRKMRSKFLERSGWSADTGTLPAGSGGKGYCPDTGCIG